ncbi:cytochrome P450 [Streptomyces sp. CA-251387]|uniref:cytochrome P450 n=1 Tax=Streptomyces sp. CA-251387 TaxID=3240064 RepID=UPI003D93724A
MKYNPACQDQSAISPEVRFGSLGKIFAQKSATGATEWIVTGFEYARLVLGDANRFSSRFINDNAPPELNAFELWDPPEHTEIRRMLMPEFNARRVRELRPSLESIVHPLLCSIAEKSPPVDLISNLVRPAAFSMMSRIVGIPESRRNDIYRWSQIFQSRSTPAQEKRQAGAEFLDMIRKIASLARHDPGDNLPSRIIRRSGVSDRELISAVATVAIAGFDSTASAVGVGLLGLLRNPDQFEKCRAYPHLIPTAVQELVRYASILPFQARIATTDAEIGGCRISAGEKVYVSLASASHDGSEFKHPDQLDVSRSPNRHLGFGYGIHHCLGRGFAEALFEIIVTGISEKFSRISIIDGEVDSQLVPADALFHAVSRLPVTFIKDLQ